MTLHPWSTGLASGATLAGVLAMILAWGGGAGAQEPSPSGPVEALSVALDGPPPLEGITWQLRGVARDGRMEGGPDGDVDLLLDGSVAMLGQVCGTTSIAYRREPGSGASGGLTFDAATTAAAACPEAGETSEPEVTEALGLVTGFSIRGDILTLLDGTGLALIELQPQELSGPEGDWRVVALDAVGEGLVPPLPRSSLMVSFQGDGRLEARTGCRGFVGGYSVDGETVTIGVQGLARLGCPRRPYEEEVALSLALQSAVSWSGTSARLELHDVTGAPRVILLPLPRLTLVGEWRVERYAGRRGELVGSLDGSEPGVAFGRSDELGGDTGCRRFSGGYFIDGDRIAIGTLQTAGVVCDDVRRRQERLFLRALGEATTWAREGPQLRLHGGDRSLLVELTLAARPGTTPSPAP